YLKFLKEIERQRVMLSKQQLGQLLAMSGKLTQLGAESAIESGEPEKSARESVGQAQQTMSQWTAQWNSLAQQFQSHPAPASCTELQSAYFDVLGSTAGSIAKVGNAFTQGVGGDASKALETLTQMQGSGTGSASKSVADAC